jgi:fibronectin-binding autotransporter adhesin
MSADPANGFSPGRRASLSVALMRWVMTAVVASVMPVAVWSQTFITWSGSNSTWSNTARWSGSNVPNTNTEVARFNSGSRTVTVNNNYTIAGINFANGVGTTTITATGAYRLTIDNAYGIQHADNSAQSIQGTVGLSLRESTSFNVSSSGNLTISGSGGINSGDSGSYALTLTGSSSGAGTISSVISNGTSGGTIALAKSGTGTWTLSGANTYTGGTTLNDGTLALGSNSALGTGSLTLNGGTLEASGGARTIANAVTLGGDFTVGGSQNLELTGAINLGGGTRTVTVDNTATTTFSGVIGQPWYSGLVKAGDGRLVLTNANTFTGPVTVSGGTLAITNNNSLGASGTWNNVVSNGATLELSNDISVTLGGIMISGDGFGSAGALRNYSGNNTLAGQVVLGSNATVNTSAGQLTLASYTDLAGHDLTVTGAGDTTFSSQINGSGSALTKSGSGTLTLSGANSYTGGTTLAAGALVANHANALGTTGNITFTGGTLQYGTGITTDWSSRLANSSGAIAIDTNGNNVTYASTIAGTNTGGLTKSGTGTLTLGAANSYTGATTVNAGTLNLQNASALGAGSTATTVASGATLQLQGGVSITGRTLNLGGTLESVSATNNWRGDIALTGNASILSSTAGQEFGIGKTDYSSVVTMGANTLTVGGAGNTRLNSFLGQTGDSGSFIKTGSGTVIFYGDENRYTGTTTVNEGTLVLDTANSFFDKTILGNLVIGDGTHSATVLYGSGSADNKIKDTSTVTINAGGLLDLKGRRDTIGALVMNGGTIDTRNVIGQQGVLTLSGDVTVGGSSTSTINGYQFSLNDQLNGSNVRNFTVADATGSTASDLTINSQVVFGGINKLGTGTMTLTGNNTYGGTTTVSAGVLNIQNNTALGAVAGGTVVNTNAALELQNNITVGNESLTLNGDGFNGSGGALRNVSGSNTWNGAISLATDSRITTDAASTLTINGTITSGSDRNVTFDSAGTTYATNAIGTGNGGITKQGDGTLYLSGNSTFHGTTAINAGVVNISHDNALGATDGGTTVASGAALELQGNIHVGAEALSLSGSGVSGGGALLNVSGNNTYGGTVTVAGSTALIQADAGSLTLSGGVATGGNALTVGGTANTTISGALTGTSAGSITKVDSSTLTISSANNNSYQGNVNINSGTLLMAANNALNNAAVDVAVNGGTFSLQTYAQTIGSLSGTGAVDFGAGDGITTFSSLTLLADSTFSGTFAGTGKIIVGAGVTLTLGNDFNAAGVTIVLAGGTLNVNGSNSTFAGLTLTGNSTIDFDSGDDSQIYFQNLSLGTYSLAVSGWADGQDYFRVANDPGNKGAAPLNQVSFGNSGPWVGNDTIWTGDYSGYGYNDEIRPWKPVPEPSTYGAMLMGAGLVFFGYRRWRQQRAAK